MKHKIFGDVVKTDNSLIRRAMLKITDLELEIEMVIKTSKNNKAAKVQIESFNNINTWLSVTGKTLLTLLETYLEDKYDITEVKKYIKNGVLVIERDGSIEINLEVENSLDILTISVTNPSARGKIQISSVNARTLL